MNGIERRDSFLFLAVILMPAVLQAADRFTFEESRISERSDKPYEIDLRYPNLRYPEKPNSAQAFNVAVKRIVQKRLAYYRAKQLPPRDSPHGGSLSLSSTAVMRRDGVVSVLFDWNCAIAGNFHSNQELASLVFDTRSAEPVELSALFRAGTDYVRVLSRLAIADLVLQRERLSLDIQGYAREWIERGAGPVARNFRVFTLTSQFLILHFVTYQVGSYLEHAYQVRIPLKTLQPYVEVRWSEDI